HAGGTARQRQNRVPPGELCRERNERLPDEALRGLESGNSHAIGTLSLLRPAAVLDGKPLAMCCRKPEYSFDARAWLRCCAENRDHPPANGSGRSAPPCPGRPNAASNSHWPNKCKMENRGGRFPRCAGGEGPEALCHRTSSSRKR